MLTTKALYSQYWKYVFRMMRAYGIYGEAQQDVAQDVWLTVHERLGSYDPKAGTMRAWIIGILRKCAAEYRRRRRRENVGLADDFLEAASAQRKGPAELSIGSLRGRGPLGPDDQALIFWMMRKALDDDEQFEAYVLRHLYGYSIEEIATIQGATERAVSYRISMAKDRISPEDDKSSGAYFGFGSLEALQDAMQSPDPPSSRGRELWERISARIGQVPAPAPGLPASAPTGPLLSKPVLMGLLGGVLLLGGEVGAAGVVACGPVPTAQVACERERTAPMAPQGTVSAEPGILATAPAPAPPVDSGATAASSSTPAAPRPALAPHAVASAEQRPPAPPAGAEDEDRDSSKLLIMQIRAAANHRNCATVRTLVDEHARTYPKLDVRAREVERARCR